MSAQETVAAALAKHADAGSRLVEIDPPVGPAELDAYRLRVSCRCGWFELVPVDQTTRPQGQRDFADVHADHQAAVLANHPNVAVVELPEPTDTYNHGTDMPMLGWEIGEGPNFVEAFPDEIQLQFDGTVVLSTNHRVAPEIAAALLAAARAAGSGR